METPPSAACSPSAAGAFTRLVLDAALLSAFEAPNFDEATAVSLDALVETAGKRCKYRSNKCDAPRTCKKNGSLHSYCEFHRQRSIANQRVFDRKKRAERERKLRRLDCCLDGRASVVKIEPLSDSDSPPFNLEPVSVATQTPCIIPDAL